MLLLEIGEQGLKITDVLFADFNNLVFGKVQNVAKAVLPKVQVGDP